LGAVAGVESMGKVGVGINSLAVNERTGAKGAFQLMGPTAKQYGVTDPFDVRQAATGAGKYLGDLSRKYGGDVSKALAAYNWGPGNLDRDIAQNGSNWQANLPRETKDYLNKIVGAIAKQQPAKVQVTVTNNTAARVAVQANAAAAQ
jgi:soluble lytic murein transglycosylase-like protein